MAQYLWQTSLTSSAWKDHIESEEEEYGFDLFDYGPSLAENFGGKVLHAWVAFGEYDYIAVVDMPDNESMAAYVLWMTAQGQYTAGKTTVLLSVEESRRALERADSLA